MCNDNIIRDNRITQLMGLGFVWKFPAIFIKKEKTITMKLDDLSNMPQIEWDKLIGIIR